MKDTPRFGISIPQFVADRAFDAVGRTSPFFDEHEQMERLAAEVVPQLS